MKNNHSENITSHRDQNAGKSIHIFSDIGRRFVKMFRVLHKLENAISERFYNEFFRPIGFTSSKYGKKSVKF